MQKFLYLIVKIVTSCLDAFCQLAKFMKNVTKKIQNVNLCSQICIGYDTGFPCLSSFFVQAEPLSLYIDNDVRTHDHTQSVLAHKHQSTCASHMSLPLVSNMTEMKELYLSVSFKVLVILSTVKRSSQNRSGYSSIGFLRQKSWR